MVKAFSALILTLLLSWGYFGNGNAQGEEKKSGGSAPVISAHFAGAEVRPGDSWKVYLKASDPDGDMKYVVATVKQAGMGVYPVSFTRIGEESRKELSGYVYLNTLTGPDYTSLTFYSLSMTLWVQDRAGNFSNPVEVPVTFGARIEAQANPPSGAFREQELGPVLIFLRSTSAGMEGGRSERFK